MKNFFGSIVNRVFLILLAGIIVATVVTTWLAANERRSTLKEIRYQHVAERVEQIVLALDDISPDARNVILQAADNFGFEAAEVKSLGDATKDSNRNSNLAEILKLRLGTNRQIAVQSETDCTSRRPRPNAGPDQRPERETCRVIYVSLRDNTLLRLRLHMPGEPPSMRSRGNPVAPYGAPYILLFLVLIAMLAYLVAKMTARPIKQPASAASELGLDIEHPPLPE